MFVCCSFDRCAADRVVAFCKFEGGGGAKKLGLDRPMGLRKSALRGSIASHTYAPTKREFS